MDKVIIDNLVLEVKKEALERGYELILSTIGASMFPLLSSHNKITVVKCDCEELGQGDLILFKSPTNNGALVAHRLIRKIKNENSHIFITKGDAVFNSDKPVTREAIIGKIIKIKKRNLSIQLEGTLGKMVNKTFLLLSLARINFFGFVLFIKLKHLFFSSSKRFTQLIVNLPFLKI